MDCSACHPPLHYRYHSLGTLQPPTDVSACDASPGRLPTLAEMTRRVYPVPYLRNVPLGYQLNLHSDGWHMHRTVTTYPVLYPPTRAQCPLPIPCV